MSPNASRALASRGSNRSRKPSPSRLSPSTASAIATPGYTASSGAWNSSVCASLSMRPHEGCGGCVPSPRYDSAASARIAMAKRMVACTISTDRMLGSTCSIVMLNEPLPQARAASTNSRDQTALADARVMRAKVGML